MYRQTDRQTHIQTDAAENIPTPLDVAGNILRVAKCATGRKCCSGRVGEKDDQVQCALRHSHVFFRWR